MNDWVAIIYILLGGFAGALQARVLGNVEAKIGILGNMLVNFLFGLLLTLFILSAYSLYQYQNPIKFYRELALERVKFWEMTAGLFGIIIVTSIGFATVRIGVTGALILFLFSQLLLGMMIDHFGWLGGDAFPISPLKLLGIVIIALGVILFFST